MTFDYKRKSSNEDVQRDFDQKDYYELCYGQTKYFNYCQELLKLLRTTHYTDLRLRDYSGQI